MTQLAKAELNLIVTSRQLAAEGVVVLELAALDNDELPIWSPGAHIDVVTGDGSPRQYSLCGNPVNRRTWKIGVLREESGRGGSRWIHDELQVGDTVIARGPRNHFQFDVAPTYLFIAGGIGVTPLLPMLAAAEAMGADYRFVYGGRTKSSMAFREELSSFGSRVQILPQSEAGLIDLDSLLRDPLEGTLVYCCGPGALLDAVEKHGQHWPHGAIRTERFSAPEVDLSSGANTSFQVKLAQSGRVLTVSEDRTLLSVLDEAGVEILSSCTQGTCGSCITSVVAGCPDHRDSVLTDEERAAGDQIIVCVSRCYGELLTLDL